MKTLLCLLLMAPFLTGWMPPLEWTISEVADYKSQKREHDFRYSDPPLYSALIPRPRPPPKRAKKQEGVCEGEEACIATGNFNFSPDGDSLRMEAACVCMTENSARVTKRGYTVASRKTPRMFSIPFFLAMIGEEKTEDNRTVYLFYKEGMKPDGTLVKRTLAPQAGAPFRYSFKEYVDNDVINVKNIPPENVITN